MNETTTAEPVPPPPPGKLIGGLRVQAGPIGAGIYAMICEQGQDGIVAFGMIPKWAIDCLETQLRAKIIYLQAERLGIPADLVRQHIDEKKLRKVMQPIVHEVTLAIYSAAKAAGRMIV